MTAVDWPLPRPATKTSAKPTTAAPERSLAQRMEALHRANMIRTKRATLKRDLKAGRASIHALLLEPPEYLETAKVFDMLLAVPAYGRVKVNKVLQVCRISPSKTVGGLSERQRAVLISTLRSRRLNPDSACHGRTSSAGTSPDAQHMVALSDANRVRLSRAELKRLVATGEITVAEIVLECPWQAESMTIADLLMGQHRWGRSRCRRFLLSIPMAETKTVGSMTVRQRKELASRLSGTYVRPTVTPGLEPTVVWVVESRSGILHLQERPGEAVCGHERFSSWKDRAAAAWDGADRCKMCSAAIDTRGLVIDA